MPTAQFYADIRAGYLKPNRQACLEDFVAIQQRRHTGDDDTIVMCSECRSNQPASLMEFYWMSGRSTYNGWCYPCMANWRNEVNFPRPNGANQYGNQFFAGQTHPQVVPSDGATDTVIIARASIPHCPVCALRHLPQCDIPMTPVPAFIIPTAVQTTVANNQAASSSQVASPFNFSVVRNAPTPLRASPYPQQ